MEQWEKDKRREPSIVDREGYRRGSGEPYEAFPTHTNARLLPRVCMCYCYSAIHLPRS